MHGTERVLYTAESSQVNIRISAIGRDRCTQPVKRMVGTQNTWIKTFTLLVWYEPCAVAIGQFNAPVWGN